MQKCEMPMSIYVKRDQKYAEMGEAYVHLCEKGSQVCRNVRDLCPFM